MALPDVAQLNWIKNEIIILNLKENIMIIVIKVQNQISNTWQPNTQPVFESLKLTTRFATT